MSGRRNGKRLLGVSLMVLLPVLFCTGGAGWIKLKSAQCENFVAEARRTVRTDTEPIRNELAPLGAKPIEAHWILYPVVNCTFLPVPGTDPDHQFGVVKLAPDAARSLAQRHTDWQPAVMPDGLGWLDEDTPRPDQLSAWIPKDTRWRHSSSLDAAYVGKQTYASARYYSDPDHALVAFWSEADNR